MTENTPLSGQSGSLTPEATGFFYGCLGVIACGGAGACYLLFRGLQLQSLVLASSTGASALAGLFAMAVALIFLPGLAADGSKRPAPLLACGVLGLACLLPEVFAPDGIVESGLFPLLYGAALAGILLLAKKLPPRPEQAPALRPMAAWSLVLAVSLALTASTMLLDAAVSKRVALAGEAAGVIAVFAAFAAFFGLMRPGLFTPVVYAGLAAVWLLVPVVGLEAYMYAEGISPQSMYATSLWKWSFGLCGISGVAAIRLLILRQDLILKRSFFADWT